MTEYRLLYAGLTSGELFGELPYLSLSHTDQLNGEGSWSATVPFDQPDSVLAPDGAGGLVAIDRSAVVDFSELGPWRTAVYVDRGGVIVGQGILVGVDLDYVAGTMTLTGPGLGAYYNHRLLPDLTWVADDQLDIARAIIDEVDPGSIGIVADSTVSGKLRDRSHLYLEAKPAGEALEELGGVEGGFDWRFRAHRESGVIVRRLHFDYPATGRVTDIVFEVGTNAALLSYSEDGSSMANNIRALGAGDGDDKLVRIASDAPLSEVPVLEASIAHLDVTDAATLDEHAQRRLQRGYRPIRRITLTTVPGTIPTPGSYDVGDRVFVRARRGWLDVADYFRIVEVSLSVDDSGEQLTLTLAAQEAFE